MNKLDDCSRQLAALLFCDSIAVSAQRKELLRGADPIVAQREFRVGEWSVHTEEIHMTKVCVEQALSTGFAVPGSEFQKA
jgi:hypothetical protein